MHNRLVGNWRVWIGLGVFAMLIAGVALNGAVFAQGSGQSDETALDFGPTTEYVGPGLWAALRRHESSGSRSGGSLRVRLGYPSNQKDTLVAAIAAVGGVKNKGRDSWTIGTEHVLGIIQRAEVLYAELDAGDYVGGSSPPSMDDVLVDVTAAYRSGVPANRAALYAFFARDGQLAVWVVIPDKATATKVRKWFADREIYVPIRPPLERTSEDIGLLLPVDQIELLHAAFANIELRAESYRGQGLGIDRSRWPKEVVDYENEVVTSLLKPKGGSAATGGGIGAVSRPSTTTTTATPTPGPWESDLEDRLDAHGVDRWHEAGFDGEGVKVGIIDWGFWGLDDVPGLEDLNIVDDDEDLDGNALCQPLTETIWPATEWITTITFRQGPCQPRIVLGKVIDHGVKVAELVKDIAPEAELFYAQAGSPRQVYVATRWLNKQEVDVIVHAGGWPYDGPGNGKSWFDDDLFEESPDRSGGDEHSPYRYYPSPLYTISEFVKEDSGPVWINAAGNFEELTMFVKNPRVVGGNGPLKDFLVLDSDGSGSLGKTCQPIPRAGSSIYIYTMRWADSWPVGGKKLDFFVSNRWFSPTLSLPGTFADSSDPNNDQMPDQYSVRRVTKASPKAGVGECLRIRVKPNLVGKVVAPKWVQFQALTSSYSGTYGEDLPSFGDTNDVGGFSIINPAESDNEGVLAVGGWDLLSDSDEPELVGYSSRGPVFEEDADYETTYPTRAKPDVVAGTGAATWRTWKDGCKGVDDPDENCGDYKLYFSGTSAATSHVGGLATLVVQWLDEVGMDYGPGDVAEYLRESGIQPSLLAADPNSDWGEGYVKLPCTATVIDVLPHSVTGDWNAKDCKSTRRGSMVVDYFTFVLSSSKTLQLDAISATDSYLYLIEGAFTGGDDYLVRDDDSGDSGGDARIVRALDAGTYTVAVMPYYAGRYGSYELRIKEVVSSSQ